MATVVTIAQQKGGAGKTSLAAHLATTWLHDGVAHGAEKSTGAKNGRVTLIDLDPQQSLATWFRLREELHGADSRIALRAVTALVGGAWAGVQRWRASQAVNLPVASARKADFLAIIRCRGDLKAIRNGKKPDLPLLPNDVVSVPRRKF